MAGIVLGLVLRLALGWDALTPVEAAVACLCIIIGYLVWLIRHLR